MSRQKLYLDIDVVEAAFQRLEHVYDIVDTTAVQVSGGKDSSAVLALVREFHKRNNLGPVTVIFRDEEMVSPATIKYIEWVKTLPDINFEHYALPQGQEIWVLGRREYVLLWSGMRRREGRLLREMPPDAITAEHFGLDPDQAIPESVDYYTMQGKKGKVAFITGVRANESMVRFRSIAQKLDTPYFVKPYRMKKSIPLWFAKVIYDWTTDDVFKYLADTGMPYSEYYDLATITGSNTRVGTPLNTVAIRRIGDVIATEPEFYDRLVECFPHIDAQRRYWADFDIEKLIREYTADGWDGVRDCIEENFLTDGFKRRAMSYAAEFRKKQALDPHGYPLHWLIRNLLMHEIVATAVNPIGPGTKAYTLQKAIEEAEANSLDLIDDMR